MNSQDFLMLNVACGLVFVVWYLSSRRNSGRRPTQLNLKAADSQPVLLKAEERSEKLTTPVVKAEAVKSVSSTESRPVKNLNIVFMYNGHNFDAYEVLGVPAGSALPEVTRAYQQALQKTDPAGHEFLEAAYKAIMDRI